MRYLAAVLALVACTKQEGAKPKPVTEEHGSAAIAPPPPDAAPPAMRGISVPSNPPPVAHIIFSCSHSNMPWGDGQQRQSRVIDLDAATVTYDSDDTPNTPKDRPPEPNAAKHTHSVAKLAAARIAPLRAAVQTVLAGGPYEPEFPPSEGISCSLALGAAAGAPFFVIDKAERAKKDAVNDLLNVLP